MEFDAPSLLSSRSYALKENIKQNPEAFFR